MMCIPMQKFNSCVRSLLDLPGISCVYRLVYIDKKTVRLWVGYSFWVYLWPGIRARVKRCICELLSCRYGVEKVLFYR